MPSETHNAIWKVLKESHVKHFINFIKDAAVSDDWNADINGVVEIIPEDSEETNYMSGIVTIIVYDRSNTPSAQDVGGEHWNNDIALSVEIQAEDREDFEEIVRKLRVLIFANNSTRQNVSNGLQERRWRLIINNVNNLSNTMGRMFSKVFDITMKTRNII